MEKYLYRQDNWDDLHELECIWDSDSGARIAEEAAEDHFINHDGWESSWPVNFEIFDLENNTLGVYSVELENRPTFSAVRE